MCCTINPDTLIPVKQRQVKWPINNLKAFQTEEGLWETFHFSFTRLTFYFNVHCKNVTLGSFLFIWPFWPFFPIKYHNKSKKQTNNLLRFLFFFHFIFDVIFLFFFPIENLKWIAAQQHPVFDFHIVKTCSVPPEHTRRKWVRNQIFHKTCAPSKCGNNIVTTASFQ